MRIRADERLAVGCMVGSYRSRSGRPAVTFIVKATCTLRHGAPAVVTREPTLLAGDSIVSGSAGPRLRYSSDFVPYKPRADVSIIASAFAPAGQRVKAIDVGIGVGSLSKQLRVFGDRSWLSGESRERSRTSDPVPFVEMPVTYERAFGGPGFVKNPSGRGYKSAELPNIENPYRPIAGPTDLPDPVGFGPIAADWWPRREMLGTFDEEWAHDSWPYFPRDFDWRYFNVAPLDQQIDGYLTGGENLEFHNLHADHSEYRSALPAVGAHCFINQRLPDGRLQFERVGLNLDTLWIDVSQERLVLAWRGMHYVRTFKARDIEDVFVLLEPLDGPILSQSEYQRIALEQLVPVEPEVAPTRDAFDPVAQRRFEDDFARMEEEFAAASRDAGGYEAELEAASLPHAQRLANDSPPIGQAGDQIAERWSEPPAAAAIAVGSDERIEPGETELAELQEVEKDLARADAEMEAIESELGSGDSPPWTRDSVELALSTGGLHGQNLSNLDLSGIDFSGVDLSECVLKRTRLSQCTFVDARLVGADLSHTHLVGASFDGANLDSADLTGAILSQTSFVGASLNSVVLSRQDLRNIDFSRCVGAFADFSHSDLTEAVFVDAELTQSDFSGSCVDRARFEGAKLRNARFGKARGIAVHMQRCELTGMYAADGTNFSDSSFQEAHAPGSIWEQARLDRSDFTSAVLTRAQFSEASARGARFDRARLEKAVFEDAVLPGAVLVDANLLRASLDRADLRGADLRGANLFEAGVWDADLTDAALGGANYKRTLLASGHGYRTDLKS